MTAHGASREPYISEKVLEPGLHALRQPIHPSTAHRHASRARSGGPPQREPVGTVLRKADDRRETRRLDRITQPADVLRRQIIARGFVFRLRHWAHALHVPYWWLRCLFWRNGANFAPVRWYHRLLVWDLLQRPRLTRSLDALLNPIMGKSVVLYFIKEQD